METLKKPCKQCPYRVDSLPGYLGESSHEPEKFLQQLESPELHPCHMSVKWDKEDEFSDKPLCMGALQFMNNSCKRSKNPKVMKLQDEAGKNPEVISFRHNFINHHQ